MQQQTAAATIANRPQAGLGCMGAEVQLGGILHEQRHIPLPGSHKRQSASRGSQLGQADPRMVEQQVGRFEYGGRFHLFRQRGGGTSRHQGPDLYRSAVQAPVAQGHRSPMLRAPFTCIQHRIPSLHLEARSIAQPSALCNKDVGKDQG